MSYLPGLQRNLEPPSPPERAKCAGCGEVYCYDDMVTINFKHYCRECQDWMAEENETEARDLARLGDE